MNQSSYIDYITIVQYKPRRKAKSVLLMNLKLPYKVRCPCFWLVIFYHLFSVRSRLEDGLYVRNFILNNKSLSLMCFNKVSSRILLFIFSLQAQEGDSERQISLL